MGRFLLSVALVVLAARAFSFAKSMEFDCAELGPGAHQSYSQTFPVRNKFVTVLTVDVVTSNPGTADAPKCHLKWTVSRKLATQSKILFQHEENVAVGVHGVALGGTSTDGSKLLLDFFSAAGDYTGHRPVVYDFVTNTWQLRDVGDRITRNLPKCDYFTMLQGVTETGDVLLYVPKSIYKREGCPDQGEWVLDMKNDTITRAAKPEATPKTQPSQQ